MCSIFIDMHNLCFKRIIDALNDWQAADVRTVPGVMYQVRCSRDEDNIDYRIHWFIDCSDTYIHNHQYPFKTYCLEGKYEEKLWKIIDDNDDTTTFQFTR